MFHCFHSLTLGNHEGQYCMQPASACEYSVLLPSRFSRVRLCDSMDYSQPGSSVHGLPGVLVVKNLPTNVRDASSIPGVGRYPGGKSHGQKGGWCATVYGIKKSRT